MAGRLSALSVHPRHRSSQCRRFDRRLSSRCLAGSDAYVAFIGLDIQLRESGKFKGQRKLTKCGEAEIRRLLFCAAQVARSYPPFDNYLQQQLEKGLSKIATKVILARKLARIAFSLLANQQSFKKQVAAYR